MFQGKIMEASKEISFQKYLCRNCGKVTYIDKQDMRHGEKVKMCPFCEKYRIMDLVGYFSMEGKEEPVENCEVEKQ